MTHDPDISDQIILFVGNTAFHYTGTGIDTAASVAGSLTYQINNYDWSSFARASVSVFATWDGTTGVTLTFARTGKVTVSGSTVSWHDNGSLPSELFVGLGPGDPFMIAGSRYTISSVTDAKTLVLTSSPIGVTGGTPYTYLAPMGGEDGNGLTCYIIPLPSNTGITLSATTLNFRGGISDGLVWTITLDFGTLTGVDPANGANPLDPSVTQYAAAALRQMWITVAPKINPGAAYPDTEGTLTISNWSVSGTGRDLKIAGPGSVRIGSRDSWCTYTGTWGKDAANIHYQGFARVSSTSGDSVCVKYSCGATHDLYIGTEFYIDRQIVDISLDGDTATAFDTYQAGDPNWGRRKVRSSVVAGNHVVTITLTGTHNASAAPAGGLYAFLFDFIEAAVPGDVQDPAVTYANVTAALDYDTFPYQMTPARLVWQLRKLGLLGKTNLDLGVFWLYNRVRVGGAFCSAVITFTGSWNNADSAVIDLAGFSIAKSIVGGDTNATIAAHFAYYINSASAGFWASAASGVLRITQRSTGVEFAATVTASAMSSGSGSVSPSTQSVGGGTEGTWIIDDAASPLLNSPIRAWLADFYATLAAASMENVTAITCEVVNPPSGYAAQFADGSAVLTATGFGTLVSTQCAVAAGNVLVLHKKTLKEVADLQNGAGLTVNWQAGEIGWWYFPRKQSIAIEFVANTFPAVIRVTAHGMTGGEMAIIVGARGGTAINGTWTVTVVDANHISIPVAGGSWTSGTGVISYGGQAYYDSETAAAAVTALGRPLASFWTQDDDPSLNPSDVAFLQWRLMLHYNTLQSYIKGLYPSAIAELLWPHDVNMSPLYWNESWSYAQGGRLNNAVNWPSDLKAKATSGFDHLLMEALSWGASYRSLDLAKLAMAWPFTAPNLWDITDVTYLVPVSNGCAYQDEYRAALNFGYSNLRFWAMDQFETQYLPLPLPANQTSVSS